MKVPEANVYTTNIKPKLHFTNRKKLKSVLLLIIFYLKGL